MDSTPCEQPLSEAQVLLRAYLEGDHREKSFARLVTHYSSLIYTSALRRCGNSALAEDITQNVLTILARKASPLAKHPNLTAWVYLTTRLETSKIMRTEKRRQRKHTSYSQDPLFANNPKLTPEEQATWKDLLPHLDASLDQLSERDRNLIFKRFFERAQFKDVAHDLKTSEGACKMQLKRALERLGSILQSHGTPLPLAALSTGLFASFATTMPSKAASTLAAQALSDSNTFSSSTFTNTLLTMTNTQQIITLSLLLVTATSIPAVQMAKESSRLQNQLQILKNDSLDLTKKSTNRLSYQTYRSSQKPIKKLLTNRSTPLDTHTFLEHLSKSMNSMDLITMLSTIYPVFEMNTEQLDQFTREIQATDAFPQSRETALDLITTINTQQSEESYPQQLERLLDMELPAPHLGNIFGKWARENPQEALIWFSEKEADGALSGKGAIDQTDYFWGALLREVLKKSPEQALEIHQNSSADKRATSLYQFTQPIFERYQESQDLSEFHAFFAQEPDINVQSKTIEIALQNLKTLPEIISVLDLQKDSTAYPERLRKSISQQNWPLKEKASALENSLSPQDYQKQVIRLFNHGDLDPAEVEIWIHGQDQQEIRDQSLSNYSRTLAFSSSFQAAYQLAQSIENSSERNDALTSIANRWQKHSPQEAEKHVSPEILESIHR